MCYLIREQAHISIGDMDMIGSLILEIYHISSSFLPGLFLLVFSAGGLEVAVGMHAVNGKSGSVHCLVVPTSGASRRPLLWPGVRCRCQGNPGVGARCR